MSRRVWKLCVVKVHVSLIYNKLFNHQSIWNWVNSAWCFHQPPSGYTLELETNLHEVSHSQKVLLWNVKAPVGPINQPGDCENFEKVRFQLYWICSWCCDVVVDAIMCLLPSVPLHMSPLSPLVTRVPTVHHLSCDHCHCTQGLCKEHLEI